LLPIITIYEQPFVKMFIFLAEQDLLIYNYQMRYFIYSSQKYFENIQMLTHISYTLSIYRVKSFKVMPKNQNRFFIIQLLRKYFRLSLIFFFLIQFISKNTRNFNSNL